jgi:hypothetical protein
MDMVTTNEALEILRQAGHKVPYSTIALWVREGRFVGAQLDENNPRGPVWLIPRSAVENFQVPQRGRPPKAKEAAAKKKAGRK